MNICIPINTQCKLTRKRDFELGSPAASPQSSDNSDTHQSGGSDIEMEEQLINRTKHVQQRLSDTEVSTLNFSL